MRRKVAISSGDIELAGHLFEPESFSHPVGILLLHGWQSNQTRMFDLAEALSSQLGATCLTFDLRGHGQSGGSQTVGTRADFLTDVLAAHNFLLDQFSNPEEVKIGIIGSSFGGYLAALLSTKRNLDWLILRVPADYPDAGFADQPLARIAGSEYLDSWRRESKNWQDSLALRAMSNFQKNIFIIQSELDEQIPAQAIASYLAAASGNPKLRHEIMAGAPHSLSGRPELIQSFNALVLEWLKNK